jgi:4'-phosphopantetheinyl transferase
VRPILVGKRLDGTATAFKHSRMQPLTAAEFQPATAPPSLRSGEIHLWFFPHWERSREATDASPVRAVLAAYLSVGPETLHFERGEHGKPSLTGLQFNLSHTGASLLLGVSRDVELGVDLEQATRRVSSVRELARRWFAPSETQTLAALPEAAQTLAFLRLWTCKEAVLKCSGAGISSGLDRVEFELSATGSVRGLRGDETWQVLALAPNDLHVGALAFRGKPLPVRAFVTQAIAAAGQSS